MKTLNKTLFLTFFISLLFIFMSSNAVSAHGGSPDSPNAFVFQGEEAPSLIDQLFVLMGVLIFGVIIVLGIILLIKKPKPNDDPKNYMEKVNLFGRNARLYILHIQGMSLTYGVRTVLFNIYLYFIFADGITIFGQVFTSLAFIGTILAIGSLVAGLVSPFAGIIVDRIGKKWSFIMGDFIGALTILVVIFFVNPFIILFMQIIRSAVMSVHSIAEGPFIYDQSSPVERVHLFSVASGMNTLASMSGNLIGGMVPVLFAFIIYHSINLPTQSVILVIQIGLLVSVALWLGSLIPALYLREAGSSFFSAIGYFIGGFLMGQDQFIIPFVGAGMFYLIAVTIFWLYFRNYPSTEQRVSKTAVTLAD